jgi:uncharacterized protein YggE
MSKIVILYFIIILNLNALDISKQKVFTTTIKPSIQIASFSLNHIAKTSNEIENLFNKAISIVNKSNICKGGQYRIYPDYKYIDNKKIEIGYNSNMNFQCEFEDITLYEKLLTKIKKLNMKLTQNKIYYNVSDTKNEEEKSKLELKAYNYAKQYTVKLNDIFQKCEIKSISFNDYNAPIQYKMLTTQETTTITSPIEEDIQISLNVNYLFNCQK